MKNMHDFYCGTMFDAYEFFGAHIYSKNGTKGIIFRVYASTVGMDLMEKWSK